MCKCTPSIRTPFCGKGDCQWPEPTSTPPRASHHAISCPECKNIIGKCACGHPDDGKHVVEMYTPCCDCLAPKLTEETKPKRRHALNQMRLAVDVFQSLAKNSGLKAFEGLAEPLIAYVQEQEYRHAKNLDFVLMEQEREARKP